MKKFRTGLFPPMLALFLHFLFYDILQNPAAKIIWIALVLLLLASALWLEYLQTRKTTKSSRIATLLAALAFVIYHVRLLLDLAPVAGVSYDAMHLPRIREFLLLLLAVVTISFYVYSALVEIAARSVQAVDLAGKKESLMLESVLGLMILLPLLVVLNYLSIIRNYNFDLSASGKYSLSEASRQLVQALQSEVEIAAFYPRPLEASGPESSLELTKIRPDVEILLNQITAANPLVKARFINADVEKDESIEYGQVSNGVITVRAARKNDMAFARQMVSARDVSDLEMLERKLVQAILNVSTREKKIYFTVANGERFSPVFDNLKNQRVYRFEEALKFINYKTLRLGVENSWPDVLPQDADAIAIIGPTIPFSPKARQAILKYAATKDARLIITLEPGGEDFSWLLQQAGLKYSPTLLSQYSDRPGVLLTKNLRPHAISESISGKSLGIVTSRSGYFVATGKEGIFVHKPLLQTGNEAYSDQNGNGKMDAADKKDSYLLAVGLETKSKQEEQGKILLFASTAWLSDEFIFYNANPDFALACFSWLNQDNAIAAIPLKKEDMKQISLSREQKLFVWTLGLFGFPFLIFIGGMYYVKKRRKFND